MLHTVDPRTKGANGQEYGNPYQYIFQQMHAGDNITLADESVYEIPQEYNYSSDRPAYIGRPSTGGNGQAPCVACGQDRIQAHFYYGWFDNKDMRRDVSVTVTGSTGQGQELIQSFDRSAWGKAVVPELISMTGTVFLVLIPSPMAHQELIFPICAFQMYI